MLPLRTLIALIVVAALATTALAHPGHEPAEHRNAASDGAPRGGKDSGSSQPERHAPADPVEEVREVDNRTRPLLPQLFLNASAEPENGTRGDVHVRELFVHARVEWNVTAGPGAPPAGNLTTDPPPNRTRPPPPPPPAGAEPRLAVLLDLPREANPGEILLATVFVRVENASRVANVTVRAQVPAGWSILPAHHHDAWNGGELSFQLDEVVEEATVYFHVLAPAGDAPSVGTFAAEAATAAQAVATSHAVAARAVTEPEPGYVPRQAVVAVGYAATLTAP